MQVGGRQRIPYARCSWVKRSGVSHRDASLGLIGADNFIFAAQSFPSTALLSEVIHTLLH